MADIYDTFRTAQAIGRSPEWLTANWKRLVRDDGFPTPIRRRGGLAWVALHIHAWVDREPPPHLLPYVQALSLAQAALKLSHEQADVIEARERLEARFLSPEQEGKNHVHHHRSHRILYSPRRRALRLGPLHCTPSPKRAGGNDLHRHSRGLHRPADVCLRISHG